VVQEKSISGVKKLLVNTTEPGQPQGPVTVQAVVRGQHQVTVFPIREGMGILDSGVAHSMEIVLSVAVSPISGMWMCCCAD
jgi:hypothetical protein